MSDKDKKQDRYPSRTNRNLDYNRCGKHGTAYPKGGSCPRCDAEARQQRK
jgi:hypothetical protein